MKSTLNTKSTVGLTATQLRELANAIDNGLIDSVQFLAITTEGDVRFACNIGKFAAPFCAYFSAFANNISRRAIEPFFETPPTKKGRKAKA